MENNFEFLQFFDFFKDIKVLKPYDYQAHLKEIELLDDSSLRYFVPQSMKTKPSDDEVKYVISEFKIMGNKLSNEKDLGLVSLFNVKDYAKSLKINFANNDRKKAITIICKVYPSRFTKHIFNDLLLKSKYKSALKIKETIEKKFSEDKEFIILFEIQINSINEVYYDNENKVFVFDLQHPPKTKSNFLVEENLIYVQQVFENIVFPFRNFQDETSNLKYRRFFVYIQEDQKKNKGFTELPNKIDVYQENILGSLTTILGNKKITYVRKSILNFYTDDYQLKTTLNFKYSDKEIADYFNLNNDVIKSAFSGLLFIHDNEKVPFLDVLKLNYLILGIISENILSYYNSIEFIENVVFNHKTNYKETFFRICKNEEYPLFLNESLTRILDDFQGMGTEFSLKEFEKKLEQVFTRLYSDFLARGIEYITRPSRNKTLIKIQRVIITPSYCLFTPYVLDQGNRILREFIAHPSLSMICVLKMDNFEEGRWNNRILLEYLKYVLMNGIILASQNFTFFDFSQSQFRNMSCWLLVNPEEILPKTGDYSGINIVAKYGARVSQTLTTTKKTALIRKENIVFIDDVVLIDPETNKIKYTFSDGVGKISYVLAQEIAKSIHLSYVPSCFQGRFLGCKGVWTTMFDDFSGNIYIRPSQKKFSVNISEVQPFELCDYSRYIQAYLNRQVILLLSALKIKDEIFLQKLDDYVSKMNNEEFIISLIHYEEWNSTFKTMYYNGITMKNDRLIRAIVDNNKDILFNELQNKARIYIKDSAYVIGIMDEYGILEYGEAFLRIKRKNFDLTLNQRCSIAKCPCLHPGDIRILNFKKYIEGDPTTEKYKVFNRYKNVLIFPSRGPRPHPNELSGSDLDGDNYFVFYDNDLVPEKTVEPMNYNMSGQKIKTKKNIKLKDVAKYFAEYINLNNLGIIGDAHLAMSDQDKEGANGRIPRGIAVKFSRAVDAPKTGDKVQLSEEENPKKFPHYMEKKAKTYFSETVLGKLYDKIREYKNELMSAGKYSEEEEDSMQRLPSRKGRKRVHSKMKTYYNEENYYNDNLCVDNWENFAFIALLFYKEYFEEIVNILNKNEIQKESTLLTGNNIDNEYSVFSKKKHNYDMRERVAGQMVEIFRKFHQRFKNGLKYIFKKKEDLIGNPNDELFFINHYDSYASACYMVSYTFHNILETKKEKLEKYKKKFTKVILSAKEEIEKEAISVSEYECFALGIDMSENYFEIEDTYQKRKNDKKKAIEEVINSHAESLKYFLKKCSSFYKNQKAPDEDFKYRILSFPWCASVHLLSKINYLKQ